MTELRPPSARGKLNVVLIFLQRVVDLQIAHQFVQFVAIVAATVIPVFLLPQRRVSIRELEQRVQRLGQFHLSPANGSRQHLLM